MSFKISDNKLLKKYTRIWKKVRNLLNIEFDSEPVYGDNDKYIKTKVKIYGEKVNTNFQGKKVPKKYVMEVFVIVFVFVKAYIYFSLGDINVMDLIVHD